MEPGKHQSILLQLIDKLLQSNTAQTTALVTAIGSISGGGTSYGTPFDNYSIANDDANSTPQYFGFLDKDDNWVILKNDTVGNYTYAIGTAGTYAAAWTARASQTYVTYSQAF